MIEYTKIDISDKTSQQMTSFIERFQEIETISHRCENFIESMENFLKIPVDGLKEHLFRFIKKPILQECDLRQVHFFLFSQTPEFCGGEYRKVPVAITGASFLPPSPQEIPKRIQDLVEWISLNSKKNPLIVAILIHHELVKIHPFIDGNGRLSRLLMNYFLLKEGLPCYPLKKRNERKYFEALSLADRGNYEPFIKHILMECSI